MEQSSYVHPLRVKKYQYTPFFIQSLLYWISWNPFSSSRQCSPDSLLRFRPGLLQDPWDQSGRLWLLLLHDLQHIATGPRCAVERSVVGFLLKNLDFGDRSRDCTAKQITVSQLGLNIIFFLVKMMTWIIQNSCPFELPFTFFLVFCHLFSVSLLIVRLHLKSKEFAIVDQSKSNILKREILKTFYCYNSNHHFYHWIQLVHWTEIFASVFFNFTIRY